jgi:hypothetical protein
MHADLIAIKRVTYAGHILRPGVAFRANTAHARVLVATGHAVLAREPAPANVDTLDVLRAAYRAKAGKAPDSRWREKRLAKEIAAL